MLEFKNAALVLENGQDKWRFGPVSTIIRAGESVAIVGKSGSGKSTFLHLAGGLIVPEQGAIFFRDKNIAGFAAREMAVFRNRHVGFVFQDFFLFDEFTLEENVAMPLFVRGESRKNALKAARLMIAETGLQGKESNRPSQLSGGQRQRAAIARAIVGKPEMLLADEPTGNLDHQTGEEVISLLFRLHQKNNMALVLVTHDNELADRAQRSLQIEDGKVVQDSFLAVS